MKTLSCPITASQTDLTGNKQLKRSFYNFLPQLPSAFRLLSPGLPSGAFKST